MPLLTWNDAYSVGVKEIDTQHQKIFELINQLYNAIVNSREKQIINSVINDLIDYANYHFSTEESYFAKFHYPDKDLHEQKHLEYRKKVNEFKENSAQNNEALSQEVLTFLEKWWTNHVIEIDKKYTKFFNDQGLI
ncbi:MAG: bacteriohemerythrin [Patescibacteria group bacterium]|nr:bacteriohemerythrin [Patescibacteria group bacterium]